MHLCVTDAKRATWVQAEELLAHMLQLAAQACHLNQS